jgi:hypothetical protein
MKKNNIYKKDGKLSFYGLCCGYVERFNTDKIWIELYIEHGHIHLRSGFHGKQWHVWETYFPNQLTEARKYFKKLTR